MLKDRETGQYTVIHNDNDALAEYINDDTVYIGFNSKHYDQYIIKGIYAGFTNQQIKSISDYIVAGHQGWLHPEFKDIWFRFNNVDIRDDMQKGLSLKAIEGHMGLDIIESEVSFDIDRPLTQAELEKTIFYCKKDVDATERIIDVRKDYLKTKLNLGKRSGIEPAKSLAATNAKLTAMLLQAKRKEWTDGRDYVYPENLDTSVIPQEILDFFDTIHDLSIPDEVLFKTSKKIEIGGMPCKYAWGGVHGSLTSYHEVATVERVIKNKDVSSLYPSLIEEYNYLSRNVPDPQIFYDIRRERLEAKRLHDKQTAKDLKLPLNTVSGAQENEFNDLYDPLPTRSLRISGQLFLTVLAMRLIKSCSTIKLLNFNTDGLMYSIDVSEVELSEQIATSWETETRFELETDDIQQVWIKDVNSLLLTKTNGEIKTVGSYLNHGISVKGAWAINNSLVIVKKALVEYFAHGTPVEETINGCNDIFQFQIIAKAGAKYREAYHLVEGKIVPVQKVNRVYATADERYGKLFKVKAETDATAKIEMLPEHCIIDNDNHLTIADVDRTFYIEMAKKRVNDFKGIKPEKKKKARAKKMPDKDKNQVTQETQVPVSKNIYERLMNVRDEFAAIGIERTGKNMQLTSKFFTLDDIVNKSRPIFHTQRFLPLDRFTVDEARLILVDIDDPDSTIEFALPMREYMGNAAVTPVQALGATVTYYRRYLYALALDLAEKDELEEGFGYAPATVHKKAPATPAQRQEAKQELTAPGEQATELQIKSLKAVLKTLREADPSKEETVAKIALQTNAFTNISKTDCEALITKIHDMLKNMETEGDSK